MDDSFSNQSLGDFVIKDKKYRRQQCLKKVKIFLIIFGILIFIAAVVIVVLVILAINYGKITCVYQTFNENETIDLINIFEDDDENKDEINFILIIGEENYKQEKTHTFKNPGNHTVTFLFKDRLTTLSHLFLGKDSLIESDLSQLEAEEITSLKGTFEECYNLKKVTFNFTESNEIKDMSNTFRNCSSLESVIFNINTEKVEDMRGMFEHCVSLKSVDLSQFKTNNLKYIDYMFDGCINLTSVDLSSFNLEHIEDMSYTFQNCHNLLAIKFPNNYITNVKFMFGLFKNCYKLTDIDLDFFRTEKVEEMSFFFEGCRNMKKINVSKFNVENVGEMEGLFKGCESITSIDLSNFKTILEAASLNSFFKGCLNLEEIDLSFVYAPIIMDMSQMFMDCINIKSIKLPPNLYGVVHMESAFQNCSKLEYLNLSNFEGNEDILDIANLFAYCSSLKNVTFPHIEADNLESTKNMFLNCESLENIDIGDFLTVILSSVESMFNGCKSLKFLNFSLFNTGEKLHDADNLFNDTSQNITLKIVFPENNSNLIYESLQNFSINYTTEFDL